MSYPRSLFGGPLKGSALVRLIYTDEAGISSWEPFTVVTAIIVHGDTQYKPVLRQLKQLYDGSVPKPYRDGFISHAKDIWWDKKYGEHWGRPERIEFLLRMMSIPSQARLGFAWTAVSREWEPPRGEGTERFSKEDLQHAYAFGWCMAAADRVIRMRMGDEMAMVVAEAIERKDQTSLLQSSLTIMKLHPGMFPQKWRTTLEKDRQAGDTQEQLEMKVERIIEEAHFVRKGMAPILEVADACSFGVRRYLGGKSHGEECARAIFGGQDPKERMHVARGEHGGGSFVMTPTEQPIHTISYRFSS